MKIFRSFIVSCIVLLSFSAVNAQNSDSLKAARQHTIDSTKAAQQHYNDSLSQARQQMRDSMKAAQKRFSDSVKTAREHIADSIASVQAYLRSKRYNDSLELARQQRLDSMKAARQHVNDSINAERQRQADSLAKVRQQYNDSISAALAAQRALQQHMRDSMDAARKHITDSIAAVNTYRKSDRYKDSVAAVRKRISDSTIAVRKAYNDSVRTAQKHITDSLAAERQKYNDSLKTALEQQRVERQHFMDSMKVVRQQRSDSLAQAKEKRDAAKKLREKERDKKKKLSLELKIKKQQDAYTNEKMRKKKWSLVRQVLQNTYTRYNYYYNANLKMKEAEANMERAAREDYSKLLPLYAFNPDKDSAKVKTDMDTIIQKTSTGIQLHDPRGKWEDNLYLLAGEAYYYSGDYKNAAAAFKYIVAEAERERKEKERKENKGKKNKTAIEPIVLGVPDKKGIAGALEHRTSKNEAMLWLARTFTQDKQSGQSQSLLDMLHNDTAFPQRLQSGIAMQQAFIDLQNEDYDNAAKNLATVANDPDAARTDRQRAAFITGQISQQAGHYDSANKYFAQVVDLKPPFDMDFYARMNMVNNDILAGNNNGSSTDMLQNMIHDPKYHSYYDQLYYALGEISLNDGQQPEAIEAFKNSIRYSQNNKRQKGKSYYTLANLYYKNGDYKNAKTAFDTAAMSLTAEDNPAYANALQLSKTLNYIAAPAAIIQRQDSLLHLSSLTEREQRAAIRKYIREQEKLMKDSAFIAQNNAAGTNTANNNFNNNSNGVGNWYFSNPSLVQQGSNDFKQKWGDRSLKDNWRLSNASFASGSNDDNASDNDEDAVGGLLNEDSLYAAIPHSPEQLADANKQLEEAYFNLGKAYYKYVEDYPGAIAAYDKLDSKYPNNDHQAEVLYHRYLMAMRNNDAAKAGAYNNTLISKFPDSEFAKALSEAAANNDNHTDNSKAIAQHYDTTYQLLMQRSYASVIQRADTAEKLFPSEYGHYAKQYNLLKAVAIAGTGNYGKADTMISQFIKMNPNDSLTPWAKNVLSYIQKNKASVVSHAPAIQNPTADTAATAKHVDAMQQQGNTSQKAIPNTDSAANNTSNTTSANTNASTFIYNPNQEQYLLISAAALDGKLMGIKSGLNDYNKMNHGSDSLSTTVTSLQDGRGIIICKRFKTMSAAKAYLNEIKKQQALFRDYGPNEADLLLISPDNLSSLYQHNNYAAYKQFYDKHYK